MAQAPANDGKTKKELARMDRRALTEFALAPGDLAARIAALDLLHSDYLLCRVARQGEDAELRVAAIQRLDAPLYQDVLFDIARTEGDLGVRLAAVGRLSAPQYLDYLMNRADTDGSAVETAAVRQLRFPKMVRDIAQSAPDPAVRQAAVACLDDDALIQTIAESDPDFRVRDAAIAHVLDLKIRKELARRLREDRTITGETVAALCADITASPATARDACSRLWEMMDDYILEPGDYPALIAALCEAMAFPVERVYDRELVSPAGIDLNGNRCAAHMLAFFYGAEIAEEDRQRILALDGVIVAYIEAETRTGDTLMRRVLFEPRGRTGVRIAV